MSVWNLPEVKAHMAKIGAKGGAAKGKSKSRGTEAARRAAKARWAKAKK